MYSILHVLREDPRLVSLVSFYEYYSFPSLYTPMAQAGIDDAGVSSVQNNPLFGALRTKGYWSG